MLYPVHDLDDEGKEENEPDNATDNTAAAVHFHIAEFRDQISNNEKGNTQYWGNGNYRCG